MTRSARSGFVDVERRIDHMCDEHIRSEMRCALLERLEQHLVKNGCDESARPTAAALVDHFDRRDHCDAEERELFPAVIRAASRRRKPRVAELVRSLATEHRELDDAWRVLRAQLVEVQRGARDRLDPALVARFGNLALAHMGREARELYPQAIETLGPDGPLARRLAASREAEEEQSDPVAA